jgi:hypothetical protein
MRTLKKNLPIAPLEKIAKLLLSVFTKIMVEENTDTF